MPSAVAALFTPLRLGDDLSLPNRIVMAPMTRCMAGPGWVPTEEMAAYYARRAEAGLIVSEGTIVRPDAQGYPNTPGVFTAEQAAGWRRVTAAVHEAGGRIFCQLWHVGRVSHPAYLDGELPVAPSAVPLSGPIAHTDLAYGTPRALALSEIGPLVEAFATAAANAMDAGFDGVEVHGANGYLIDQFLHHRTNLRDDGYGGDPPRMARFCLEVVDAVCEASGADRVGIRLSPAAYHHLQPDPRDPEVFHYLLCALEERGLAYVHAGIADDTWEFDYLGGQVADFLRAHYEGTLIACGAFTPEAAAKALTDHRCDLAAFGRPFIANPDLVGRVRAGEPLVPFDEAMLGRLE
ncbi:MAG: alkene reductase [Nitrospirota bacterium]|jgi:2,4-dienoyl-CoA reductase-like NADH-dependent reductase (Old Yellow Enzyme family)